MPLVLFSIGVLLAPTARAQNESPLQQLNRAGRAIAAAPCAHPRENKLNRVGGSSDEMQAIDCRSYRIALYIEHSAGARRVLPMALVVQASEPALPLPLPAGLNVGAETAAVRARLGPPSREHGAGFSYLLDASRPAGDSISFEVVNGRVSAIDWNWRVD